MSKHYSEQLLEDNVRQIQALASRIFSSTGPKAPGQFIG